MKVEIVGQVLPSPQVTERIKAGPDGPVCVSHGMVRNNTRVWPTFYLDSEAMVLAQMNQLAAQATERFVLGEK
jgi:molybdopterin synthase catalytic subunit